MQRVMLKSKIHRATITASDLHYVGSITIDPDLLEAAREALSAAGVEPEYVALVDPQTLEPCPALARESLLAVAARIGEVRLIDNAVLQPREQSSPSRSSEREAIA